METRTDDPKKQGSAAFDEIDTTLNAVRLMMEAEERKPTEPQQPQQSEARPEARQNTGAEAADEAQPKTGKRRRGLAALPDLDPTGGTRRVWRAVRGAANSEPSSSEPSMADTAPGPDETAGNEVFAGEGYGEGAMAGTAELADGRDVADAGRKLPVARIAILLSVAVVIWLKPWLIPGVLFMILWIALIVHLTVGPERMAELMVPVRRFLVARFPEKAAVWRTRLQDAADSIEGLIEKLPERWQDGIYLPDLGRSERDGAEQPDDDPFERLALERNRAPEHV